MSLYSWGWYVYINIQIHQKVPVILRSYDVTPQHDILDIHKKIPRPDWRIIQN